MRNNGNSALQKKTKEMMELLEKCQPEQKSYIAGVIDGMAAERRIAQTTDDTRSA